jgi:hypothetical protein
MKLKRMRFAGVLLVALGALLGYLAATGKVPSLVRAQAEKTGAPGNGQQVTGVLGSPGATTTIDGRYLPNPPPAFGGEIMPNALQSKPYWPPRVVPPKDAPNILLIMTDDTGFGASSTFGGVIPTPAPAGCASVPRIRPSPPRERPDRRTMILPDYGRRHRRPAA